MLSTALPVTGVLKTEALDGNLTSGRDIEEFEALSSLDGAYREIRNGIVDAWPASAKEHQRRLVYFRSWFLGSPGSSPRSIADIVSQERVAYLRLTHGFWDYLVRFSLLDASAGTSLSVLDRRSAFDRDAVRWSGFTESIWNRIRQKDQLSTTFWAPTFDNGTVNPDEEFHAINNLAEYGILYKYFQLAAFESLFVRTQYPSDASLPKTLVLETALANDFRDFLSDTFLVVIANFETLELIKASPFGDYVDCTIPLPRHRQSLSHFFRSETLGRHVARTLTQRNPSVPVVVLSQASVLTVFIQIALEETDLDFRIIDMGKSLETLFRPDVISGGWFGKSGPAGCYPDSGNEKELPLVHATRKPTHLIHVSVNEDPLR